MNVNSFLKKVREGYSPSKAEEVALVEALRDTFAQYPANTYLSSLFTADLTQYVAATIRDDMTPDIKAEAEARANQIQQHLNAASEEKRLLADELAKAQKRIVQLESHADSLAEKAELFRQDAAAAKNQTMYTREHLHNAHDCINYIQQRTMAAWIDGKNITPEELRALLMDYSVATDATNARHEDL
jgi:hypothetical protein